MSPLNNHIRIILLAAALGRVSATAAETVRDPVNDKAAGTPAEGAAPAGESAPAQVTAGTGTLLLGDSMMKVGVAPALKWSLDEAFKSPVTVLAKSATGLARPDTFDWPAAARAALTATDRYQRIVVILGTNDCQSFADNGQILTYGSPAWQAAYRTRVRDFLDLLCAHTDGLLWVGLPPMRNTKFSRRIHDLNTLLAEQVTASRCGRWLPAPADFADRQGNFRSYVTRARRQIRLRTEDGIHITPDGGRIMSESVLAALKAPGSG